MWAETVVKILPEWVMIVQGAAVIFASVYAFRRQKFYVINHWYLLGIGLAIVPAAIFYADILTNNRPLIESVALSRIGRSFLFAILGSILILLPKDNAPE